MATLNPKMAAFYPDQMSSCFSVPGATPAFSSCEVGDGKVLTRYDLDGCFTNGALRTYTGRRNSSSPGTLPTIYKEDELEELETLIDDFLNGEHCSRPVIHDATDTYEEDMLDTCIDNYQNDEHFSSLAVDDAEYLSADGADHFAPQSMYTASVRVSKPYQRPWWPCNPQTSESWTHFGPYYDPGYDCCSYATPYNWSEGFPCLCRGCACAGYPVPYDWLSYPADVPIQVIEANTYSEYATPFNRYPFPIQGSANFILDHSMYSPKYMDVGPDADSDGCYPAVEGEQFEEPNPRSFNDIFDHCVLAEDVANQSFRHAPQHIDLPTWDLGETYNGHSADLEIWKGLCMRDAKFGWGDDECYSLA